jgi:hypothetical protein
MLYRVHFATNEVFAKKLHRNNHAKNAYITSTKQENAKIEYKNIVGHVTNGRYNEKNSRAANIFSEC